jgi:hypothetical protein
MVAECFGAIALGWVHETFVDVKHSFTFFGFEWTDFLIGSTMTWYYVVMGIFGFAIMLGYRYRLSAFIFSIMWALSYFMQKSHYNNHYYLVMLVSFWMLIMPAHRYASLDVKQRRVKASLSCPNWAILYFKIQFAIVYFYAAIAKVYPDWLQATPIQIWLKNKTHYPIVGGLFEYEWFPYFIAYGGLFFDALVIPCLLFKRTRVLAIGLSLVFHLFNSAVFQIGIFPYFALAVALFFFDPEDIRRLFLKKKPVYIPDVFSNRHPNNWITPIFVVYFIIQLLLPIRHHFIKGNVLWDEAGHRLSWRMMLRAKAGVCTYVVKYGQDQEKRIPGREFLQMHQVHDVNTRPDMLYRSIDYLKEYLDSMGIEPTAIYCKSQVSVNGRPYATFVKPDFDMLKAKWNFYGKQEWIAEEPYLGWVTDPGKTGSPKK